MGRGNIDSRVEVIPANGVLNLSNANFIFLQSASVAVALKFVQGSLGSSENFGNVTAGLQISRVKPWAYCNVTGPAGTTVNFWYGYTDVREDNTIFSQQIAVIAGVTAVAIQPSSVISSPAPDAILTATALSIPANLTRRRITITSLSVNTGSVLAQSAGAGASRGLEIQPGTFVEFDTTAAIDIRNDSGATQVINRFEES